MGQSLNRGIGKGPWSKRSTRRRGDGRLRRRGRIQFACSIRVRARRTRYSGPGRSLLYRQPCAASSRASRPAGFQHAVTYLLLYVTASPASLPTRARVPHRGLTTTAFLAGLIHAPQNYHAGRAVTVRSSLAQRLRESSGRGRCRRVPRAYRRAHHRFSVMTGSRATSRRRCLVSRAARGHPPQFRVDHSHERAPTTSSARPRPLAAHTGVTKGVTAVFPSIEDTVRVSRQELAHLPRTEGLTS